VSEADPDNWRPTFTGDNSIGDVGSGEEFGADLFELYHAGRVLFPEIATRYSELTMRVHRQETTLRVLFEVDGSVPERAHRMLLELREELQHVLRQSSINIDESGRALVTIADSYAATDEQAAAEMTRKLDRYQDVFVHAPTRVPTPPAPGDPQPAPTRPAVVDLAEPV
jgi:hypothetical protein